MGTFGNGLPRAFIGVVTLEVVFGSAGGLAGSTDGLGGAASGLGGGDLVRSDETSLPVDSC